jgi:SAM-dependent methyltransferase
MNMQESLTGINVEEINQKFWDTSGAEKSFSDPFFIKEFAQHLSKESRILDYGCGYGRLIKLLREAGYQNITGFEKSKGMLERAKNFLGETPPIISDCAGLQKDSFDSIVLSTVLCCNPTDIGIKNIINTIAKVLKHNGLLYFCDFLISASPKYIEKYNEGFKEFGIYGVYRTSENILVRHFSKTYLLDLFKNFLVIWNKDIEYITMNKNPALQTHMILKISKRSE